MLQSLAVSFSRDMYFGSLKAALLTVAGMLLLSLSACTYTFKTPAEFKKSAVTETYVVDRSLAGVMGIMSRQAGKCLMTEVPVLTGNSRTDEWWKIVHVFEPHLLESKSKGQLGLTKAQKFGGSNVSSYNDKYRVGDVLREPNYIYVVDFVSLGRNRTQVTTHHGYVVYNDLNQGLKSWLKKGARGCPDISDLTKLGGM